MVGGEKGVGWGSHPWRIVEETRSIKMGRSQKKVLPKGALAIILHTCEFPEGNTWAKRITKQAIKVLGAQDEVGVLDYEQKDQWIFALTPAADYHKPSPNATPAPPASSPTHPRTIPTRPA